MALRHRRLGLTIAAVVASMVFAAALAAPDRVAAQEPTAVGVCPVPVAAVPASGGLEVCIDRGAGATYTEGDPITVCVTANIPQIAIFPPPPPPTIRVTDIVNGVPRGVLIEERFASGERCFTGVVVPPLGQETLRAEAINTEGEVFLTDTVSFRTVPAQTPPPTPAPTAPSDLAAFTVSNSAIVLAWQDNALIEDTYRVWQGGALIAEIGANRQAYLVEGLTPDTWNCFRVEAVNDGAGSALSNWACAWTNALG